MLSVAFFIIMLSVFVLNVTMLSVIMLIAVMLNVIMLIAVMLNVVSPSVLFHFENYKLFNQLIFLN